MVKSCARVQSLLCLGSCRGSTSLWLYRLDYPANTNRAWKIERKIMIKTQGHFSQAALAGLALLLWACAGPGPLAAADQKTTGDNSETSTQTKHLVNVNTADAKTLATLPGVGPTIAQHIIYGRPYHSLADIEKVKGLGP